jgi:tetratricopeptide (TPR) repeat protein
VRVTLAAPRKRRRESAAAIAGAAAFATGAALDWAWELSVLPVAFLILLGAVLGRDEAAAEGETPASNSVRTRVAVAVLSIIAVAVTAPPLLGATAIRDSQAKFRSGDLDGALSDADRANDFEPYSGAAALQKALVLEALDRFDEAADAAREATREESTNWQNWFALARIERKLGLRDEAGADLDRSRDLNPSAPVFDRGSAQSADRD